MSNSNWTKWCTIQCNFKISKLDEREALTDLKQRARYACVVLHSVHLLTNFELENVFWALFFQQRHRFSAKITLWIVDHEVQLLSNRINNKFWHDEAPEGDKLSSNFHQLLKKWRAFRRKVVIAMRLQFGCTPRYRQPANRLSVWVIHRFASE